jgi:hypothetical protein
MQPLEARMVHFFQRTAESGPKRTMLGKEFVWNSIMVIVTQGIVIIPYVWFFFVVSA